ncbi:MAG TPA: hypothetical protein PKW90_18410, partial [Myxococcota bacterium]|nr:hypothetical protein [Myxococcota bacterium]
SGGHHLRGASPPGGITSGGHHLRATGGCLASNTKVVGLLFPRKRYVGGANLRGYSPVERSKMAKLLGQGYRLHLHTRIYDLSASGAPTVNFGIYHGCFADELPVDGLQLFALTPTSTPALPYSAAPDDAYAVVDLGMGMVDVGLLISGSGTCWAEVEVWYTLELEK